MLVGNINQHHFQSLTLRQRISNPAIADGSVDFIITRPSYAEVCKSPPKKPTTVTTNQSNELYTGVDVKFYGFPCQEVEALRVKIIISFQKKHEGNA